MIDRKSRRERWICQPDLLRLPVTAPAASTYAITGACPAAPRVPAVGGPAVHGAGDAAGAARERRRHDGGGHRPWLRRGQLGTDQRRRHPRVIRTPTSALPS